MRTFEGVVSSAKKLCGVHFMNAAVLCEHRRERVVQFRTSVSEEGKVENRFGDFLSGSVHVPSRCDTASLGRLMKTLEPN